MKKLVSLILLGWPGAGERVRLKAFAADSLRRPLEIAAVSMVNSDAPITWEPDEAGLSLTMPDQAPDDMAVVFRIEAG